MHSCSSWKLALPAIYENEANLDGILPVFLCIVQSFRMGSRMTSIKNWIAHELLIECIEYLDISIACRS